MLVGSGARDRVRDSCIEHVGPSMNQAAFAREVRRLAPSYYVQAPARGFSIEAHTGLPFWWYYPTGMRTRLIKRWQARRPAYGAFIVERVYCAVVS